VVGRGHGLLGRPLGGAGDLQMIVVTATATVVAGLVVMVMMVMVPGGHVAGRGRVVQLRVELQRRRYLHAGGRVTATAATVVTAAAQLVVTVRVSDGHHVVRGPDGPCR